MEGKEMTTLDGIPLREGEKGKYFENHSLSWWRQFTVNEHKKNGTEPLYPSLLTAALYEDFTNHFGFPEHLRGKDMDPDGLARLCYAVVKSVVNEIVDAKVCEYNGWRNLKGKWVKADVMIELRQKAEECLHRKSFQMYLFGADPDGIIKEAYRVAQVTVDDFYREQEKQISAYIRKSGITVKDLVAELRKLNIDNDEIPEWITHCTPQRMETLKKIIKRLKKQKEEQDGRNEKS